MVLGLYRPESSGNWPLVHREWPARGNFVGNAIRDNKYEIPQAGCDWRAGWGHPKLPLGNGTCDPQGDWAVCDSMGNDNALPFYVNILESLGITLLNST